MFKLILFINVLAFSLIVSIYSLNVADISSGAIHFNDYRNKKILIVNTATGDSSANQQLVELQQLYQQHQDSLVIIAFPSNSFGNEPGTNEQIRAIMQGTYGITFPISAKSEVKGESENVVYQWLGSEQLNGMMDTRTKRDFQKYLIDGTGRLVAKFDSIVSPVSAIMQSAISRY